MNITNYYNFSQGLSVISPYGFQRYTEKLDSYSSILNNIYSSDYNKNNKYCIDSCWESGNIYYANYDEGCVKKIKFDGTVIATLNLSRPFMVSIIQKSSVMGSTVEHTSQDEIGCWIADKGTGKIIKTDNNLNILKEIDYIVNPIGIISDVDGGCYVVSYYITSSIKGNLIKLSSEGEVVGIKNYYDFSPIVTGFIDISMDSSGQVYFCANDNVYSLSYSEGNIVQNYVLSPITTDDPFSSSSSQVYVGEEKHVGCIDVDRNGPYQPLYIAGGNSSESFIVKYIGGSLVAQKQYYDIGMPYVIKAIQGMGSDSLYILEDSLKWEDYGYGSSSSSSYIENWSSSSSKSSSSNSSSSNSSSSSSSGKICIWTEQINSGNNSWRGVASSSDGSKLAACSYGGRKYVSNDYGSIWNSNGSSFANWTSIASSSDGTKLAVSIYGGYIETSTDSGITWNYQFGSGGGTGLLWTCIASSSDGSRLAATQDIATFGGYIWTSSDYGVTWTQQAGSYTGNFIGWKYIASSSDGLKLIACTMGSLVDGYVYTSSNYGVNWTQRVAAGYRKWTVVSSSSDGTKLAACVGGGLSSSDTGYIYVSTNSGVNWIERTGAGNRNWISLSLSSNGGILVAGSNAGYIYVSYNLGVSWVAQTQAGERIWTSIATSSDGVRIIASSQSEYLWTGLNYDPH